MSAEIFVYYRVRMNQRETAQELVKAFQARLCARHPGLQARLMQRADDASGTPTWMEHYAFDRSLRPEGVAPELQAQIEAEAQALLPTCIDGARHTEVFVACAS